MAVTINNLVQADALSYHVSRMPLGQVMEDAAVKQWMGECNEVEEVKLLRQEIEQLNIRRGNEGLHYLPTHVFYLLDFNPERHARNKTEQKKWEKMQVNISLALAVPYKELSLPWMVYETLDKQRNS